MAEFYDRFNDPHISIFLGLPISDNRTLASIPQIWVWLLVITISWRHAYFLGHGIYFNQYLTWIGIWLKTTRLSLPSN